MAMTPLNRSNTIASRGLDYDPYRSKPVNPDRILADWHTRRAAISNQKFRLPASLAAGRIGLSDTRCVDLANHIESAKRLLLNPPSSASFDQVMGLEDRLLRLEEQLHNERIRLWKELLPLVTAARDASVEAMRSSFLQEFTHQASADDRNAYSTGGVYRT